MTNKRRMSNGIEAAPWPDAESMEADRDLPALICNDECLSYGQILDRSRDLARALRAFGVGQGDRVAIQMLNVPEVVFAMHACFLLGAVAVPMNARLIAGDLRDLFGRLCPTVFLGQSALYAEMGKVEPALIAYDRRFLLGGEADGSSARSWDDLFSAAKSEDGGDFEPGSPDDTAVLLVTSGTTRRSKLVVHTFRTLAAMSESALRVGMATGRPAVATVPLMHGSGLFCLGACLGQGVPLVLIPRFDPDMVLDAIERHGCTWYGGLPFMHAELARCQTTRPRDLTSLQTCVSAGDMCSSEVEKRFEAVTGRPLLSFWAASEDLGATVPVRVGPFMRPGPHTEIRLLDDEDGQDVSDGHIGHMLIRSPSTSPGYWQAPGIVDGMPGGWLETGDLFSKEPDGSYRFAGRTKDVIISHGSNISPVEVELALMELPSIIDAAVVGLPDPVTGQRVAAAIVSHAPPGSEALQAQLHHVLAAHKVPERFLVVVAIPRNALGKVMRSHLVSLFQERGEM